MEGQGGIPLKQNLYRLRCSVQHYNWGRIGPESTVARLYAANSGAFIDSSKPYAEFWMGTHESGPSFVVEKSADLVNGDGNGDGGLKDEMTLKAWIAKNPSIIGDKVVEKYGCDLPFLFKVLSVAKPLSIQAHPDKVLAKKLNALHPDLYKDDNHKPELCLALTEFEAICGFLGIKELKEVIQNVPEIQDLVGIESRDKVLNIDDNEKEENIKDVFKALFTEIMSASGDLVAEVLSKLKNRLNMISKEKLTPKEQLVLRLEEEYPGDIGVITALFMNHVKLKPSEALCIAENELHAYLSGDCIECMATSDNVVRAGLTPKRRDVETLCSMLAFNLGFPDIVEGNSINEYMKKYRPSFEEFEIDLCDFPAGASSSFSVSPGPSIFVILEGNGTMSTKDHEKEETVALGDVLFAPAMVEVNIKASRQLKLCRAGVNSQFL